MDQRYLKQRLLYAPLRGVFYWIDPPRYHLDLLGEEAGCVQVGKKSYHVIQVDGVRYKRSRLAFLYMTGKSCSDCIDHINGDSLDDRWMNLRAATVTENAWNHRFRKKSSELPMGVRINPSGRFSARIGVHGKQVQIGTFDTAAQAEFAYQKARVKYYGQFA